MTYFLSSEQRGRVSELLLWALDFDCSEGGGQDESRQEKAHLALGHLETICVRHSRVHLCLNLRRVSAPPCAIVLGGFVLVLCLYESSQPYRAEIHPFQQMSRNSHQRERAQSTLAYHVQRRRAEQQAVSVTPPTILSCGENLVTIPPARALQSAPLRCRSRGKPTRSLPACPPSACRCLLAQIGGTVQTGAGLSVTGHRRIAVKQTWSSHTHGR